MADPRGAKFRWTKPRVDDGEMPPYISTKSSGSNPCLLVGSKVFMVGRIGRPGHYGSSFGICDLRLKRWIWKFDPSQDAPFVNGGVVFLVDDALYYHGGFIQETSFSDKVFRLDLAILEWEECDIRGIKPPGLVWQAGEYLERHKSYVCFGGRFSAGNNIAEATNNVWIYQIERRCWYKPTVKGRAPAVQGVTSCVVGEKIFFFGGMTSTWRNPDSDLYILERQNSNWLKVNWTTLNLGINLSFGSLTYAHGILLIFGGFGEDLQARDSLFACELPNYVVLDMRNQDAKYSVHGYVRRTYSHSLNRIPWERVRFRRIRAWL